MPRPKGLLLHKPALALFLVARRLTLTEAAELFGLPLTTLSGLAQGNHRASIQTVRQIEDTAGADVAAALFPELGGLYVASGVAA